MFKPAALIFLPLLTASTLSLSDPAHTQIFAMTEADRQAFMFNFLNSSGEKCSQVTKTFYQGSDGQGNAFWSVACARGDAVQIIISNNATGSARLLSCKVLKAINAGTCFTKFK